MVMVNTQAITTQIQRVASLSQNGHACERKGYPILLLRKSAIRKTWLDQPTHQVPSLDKREPNEKLSDHYYILRRLRSGYVYILTVNGSKREYLAHYQVADDGTLKQKWANDLNHDKKEDLAPRCYIDNHYANASFITFNVCDIDTTSLIYIAYSRYPWNKKTREYYQTANTSLARFSLIRFPDFNNLLYPRTTILRNAFVHQTASNHHNILEFRSEESLSHKVKSLPNYINCADKRPQFDSFIQHYEGQGISVKGLVLEDCFGLIEDLNFQRNTEINYAGNEEYAKNKKDIENKKYVQNKKEPLHEHIPYTYNSLYEKENQLLKINYDLIELYRKTSNLEINKLKGIDKKKYEQFDRAVRDNNYAKMNNSRDYALITRWFFNVQSSGNVTKILSGNSLDLPNNQTIYLPAQSIRNYNKYAFWKTEFNFDDKMIYEQILDDCLSLFITYDDSSYYHIGLWDELLSNKDSFFYFTTQGNDRTFWTLAKEEKNLKILADQAEKLLSVFQGFYISTAVKAISFIHALQIKNVDKIIQKLSTSKGVKELFTNAGFQDPDLRKIRILINLEQLELLQSTQIKVTNVKKTNVKKTKSAYVTLTLFCDKSGFNEIQKYVNRAGRDQNPIKNIKGLTNKIEKNVLYGVAAGHMDDEIQDLQLTLSKNKLNALEFSLKEKFNTFAGFEVVNELSSDDQKTVKIQCKGNPDYLNSMKKYLKRYASHQNSTAQVSTIVTKFQNYHLDFTINTGSINHACNLIAELIPGTVKQLSSVIKNENFLSSTGLLFSLVVQLWQAKLLKDNIDEILTNPALSNTEKNDLIASIGIGIGGFIAEAVIFSESLLNNKIIMNFGKRLNASFVQKLEQKSLSSSVRTILRISVRFSKVFVVCDGVKNIILGCQKISLGSIESGLWMSLSGGLLIASAFCSATVVGTIASIVLVLLSAVCAVMSELTMITKIEEWFDKCYFGEHYNNIIYPLTEKGVKKLLNDFYLAINNIDIRLTGKKITTAEVENSYYDIILTLRWPAKDKYISYEGVLLVLNKPNEEYERQTYACVGHKSLALKDDKTTIVFYKPTHEFISTYLPTMAKRDKTQPEKKEGPYNEILLTDLDENKYGSLFSSNVSDAVYSSNNNGYNVISKKLYQQPASKIDFYNDLNGEIGTKIVGVISIGLDENAMDIEICQYLEIVD